jgi:hypothetical protein
LCINREDLAYEVLIPIPWSSHKFRNPS